MVEVPDTLLNTGISTSNSINADDLQNIAVLLGAMGYVVWERRPQGSAKSDLIAIQKSTIKNANLGVFAVKTIPAGTIVGEFPGFVTSMNDALASKKDDAARKSAQQYIWDLSDGNVLDPTNAEGILELELSYFFGLYKVDTSMARINEPIMRKDNLIPMGKYDCNVFTRVIQGKLEVIAERDIFPGEELFMDYGNRYDRSSYDSQFDDNAQEEKLEKMRKQQEKVDAMAVQRIINDATNTVIDQDTSIPDGFIAKLSKQDKSTVNRLERLGILSPEDGAELFRSVGSSMFSSSSLDDQELMKEMALGKKPAAVDILNPEDATNRVLSNAGVKLEGKDMKDMTDDQLLSSLFGAAAVSAAKATASIESNEKDSMKATAPKTTKPSSSYSSAASASSTGSSSAASTASGDSAATSLPTTKRALSDDEAEELQQKVDSLSDEELERVFAKMRTAIGVKAFEDLKRPAQQPEMPRAPPKDAAIRSKYKTELDAIEDELANIFKDPMRIWEELKENPEPLLGLENGGGGGGGIASGDDDQEKLTEKLIDKDLQ